MHIPDLTPQEQLDAAVKASIKALQLAESIADEHKLSFSYCPAYGMGGYYTGDPAKRESWKEDGWTSSSETC